MTNNASWVRSVQELSGICPSAWMSMDVINITNTMAKEDKLQQLTDNCLHVISHFGIASLTLIFP